MVFMTANGMTETKEVAKCSVDSFSEETKPFVLEQSPAVFSVDVDQFRMDDVLAEPPSDLRFTGPTEKSQRVPIDQLRPVRTVNPLTNVDFDSVNPKPMMKEDRMWFPILPRTSPEGNEFHQNDSSKMHMCSQCSRDKLSGIYNDREDYATHCPNCASNFCRKFYFDQHDPLRSDMVLRWAASTILKEKEISRFWGNLRPADNIRTWMYETINVFRNHPTGIGKYVSHFGTTRMSLKAATNAMYQGQGKQTSVDRHQVVGPGPGTDYYHSSHLIMATECILTT